MADISARPADFSRKRAAGVAPRVAAFLASIALQLCACAAEPPPRSEELRFTGPLIEAADLSAVENLGELLIVGSDEGSRIQILRPEGDGITFRAVPEGIPLLPGDVEIDIEGLDRDGAALYVLGSHALKRLRLKPERSRAENRRRLATVAPEDARHGIFRLEIDPATGQPAGPVRSINLRPILEADPILGPFTRIPGKENGVNIEAIATRDSKLFLGFRSPVLRGGFVPVMVLTFDNPASYQLLFVQLDGRGIRAMDTVRDGFVLVAGFERSHERTTELFLWDGRDQVPGRDAPQARPRQLAAWKQQAAGPVEALTLLEESDSEYVILLLHDAVKGGWPLRARIPKTDR